MENKKWLMEKNSLFVELDGLTKEYGTTNIENMYSSIEVMEATNGI